MRVSGTIAGVILAGGTGQRMFPPSAIDRDKGLLAIGDAPMIGHVITTLRPQVSALAINANGAPERFARFQLPVIADAAPAGEGPLSGLIAGLDWLHRTFGPDAEGLVTAASDTPFLPEDLVARLIRARAGQQERIAVAQSAGRVHPTIGLWPLALRDDAHAMLRRGERSIGAFARRHDAIAVSYALVTIAGRDHDPFYNANTPQDLDDARAVIAHKDRAKKDLATKKE